jgi:hypothetical protein
MNKKGRSVRGPLFTSLFHYMQDSAAWRSCTPADRAVYIEVARVFNGCNNGFLGRSVRMLGDLANINKDTAAKSLIRLMERGLLECATPGGFSRKTPHASEWRLTVYRCDRTGQAASREFLKWRPKMQNAVPNEGQSVRNEGSVTPLKAVNCPKPGDSKAPFPNMNGPLVSDTYTSSHRQGVANG